MPVGERALGVRSNAFQESLEMHGTIAAHSYLLMPETAADFENAAFLQMDTTSGPDTSLNQRTHP